MATEFDIGAPTRRCSATGRELLPGERFHGALLDEAGKFVRKDFAPEAWGGPPDGAVAHWLGRVPTGEAPKRPKFDEALLLECLDHLAGSSDPHRLNFRYVAALLLMRRKRLKFEDSQTRADGQTVMVVRDGRTGKRQEIADPRLGEAEIAAVQDEVFRVLGWE